MPTASVDAVQFTVALFQTVDVAVTAVGTVGAVVSAAAVVALALVLEAEALAEPSIATT